MNFLAQSVVSLDTRRCGQDAQVRSGVAGTGRCVAAYDLIATDDELLTDAARRYFKSQPVATGSMILITGLHLVGGLPRWSDPFALFFATCRRLRLLLL